MKSEILDFLEREANNMATQREEKERQKARREKIGGYFLDLSKLTFGTTVLAGVTSPLSEYSLAKGVIMIIGAATTVVFYSIGNQVLK